MHYGICRIHCFWRLTHTEGLNVRMYWPLVLFDLKWNDCRRGLSLCWPPVEAAIDLYWLNQLLAGIHDKCCSDLHIPHYFNANAHLPLSLLPFSLFRVTFPVVVALCLSTPCFLSATRGSQGCKAYVFVSHLSLAHLCFLVSRLHCRICSACFVGQ